MTNNQYPSGRFSWSYCQENLYLVYSLISAWEGFCYLENSVCNNQIAVWVGVELSGIESWFQWFIKSFFFFINDRSLLFVFSTSRLLSLLEVFKALEGSLKSSIWAQLYVSLVVIIDAAALAKEGKQFNSPSTHFPHYWRVHKKYGGYCKRST